MPGVELEATMLLNLLRGDWLTRMPAWGEGLLLLGFALLAGYGMHGCRPLGGAVGGGLLAVGMSLAAIGVARATGCWWNWSLVVFGQLPCAWLLATTAQTRRLARAKLFLEKRLATAPTGLLTTVYPTHEPAPADGAGLADAPAVADHVLLRRIGRGAYGEVFLARNAVGWHAAVKVLRRADFSGPEPYVRELRGIQHYMPVSRNHAGLVHLLQVGCPAGAGYFYYVMELADDRSTGVRFDPAHYVPRTLGSELRARGALPVADCLTHFLPLVAALDYLHREQLVHRDIKPANIIYVRGAPKFADIGLVTNIAGPAGGAPDRLGTLGYMPPEGPGAPGADVFSLGIVMYEAATGLSQRQFPELPGALADRPDRRAFARWNRICLRACDADPRVRYRSAAELYEELVRLDRWMMA